MSSHRATNKLKIVDYFDDLKNKIDLLVEIFINDNQHDQARIDEINKAREEWIKEADECQAFNLAELEKNKRKDEQITDEELFKRHCFLIKSCADLQTGCFTGRFISTDVYLRPGQIECYEKLLGFASNGKIYFSNKQLAKNLDSIFVGVEICNEYNLKDMLQVKNSTLNIEQHNLSVIKEPSKTLFAFTSAVIGVKIQAIQPDASFLFTRLIKLTLKAVEGRPEIYSGENIIRIVNLFEAVSSLQSELNVELKFGKDWYDFSDRKANELQVTLGDRIGTARQRLDALNMIEIPKKAIKDLFTLISKKNDNSAEELVCWPRLTELHMIGCGMETLNSPLMFEILVPNLRELHLCPNTKKFLDPNVIIIKHMLRNEAFHGFVNLRVLNVNLVTLDSLEPFSCLCNLEELMIHVENEKVQVKRLDAFPSQLSKLRVLKLTLVCKVEWISPTFFDHLTCLERFEFGCYEFYSNAWQVIQPFEIKVAPRFLKLYPIKKLRLVGGKSSVANIETIELCEFEPNTFGRLHYNELSELGCYWPLSGLKRLNAMPMKKNSLSFNKMLNLEILNLKLYDYGVLDWRALGCLSKLKELQLRFEIQTDTVDKGPSEIDCKMFTGLSSLTKLVITNFEQLTRIVSLPATLERVDLSFNAIDVIEPNAFRLLNKLEYLNLDYNELTAEIIFPAIAHLTNLEQFFLRSNTIDSVEGLRFVRLPRLRVLNLEDSLIEKLSKQTFATLPGLVNLNLGGNGITEIEAGAFDGLLNLRVLNLDHSKLRVFYFDVFESASNKLGSPVNLMQLFFDPDSIISVRWSPEKMGLPDESMSEKEENKKLEADEAARLFAKCGFRNQLYVGLGYFKELNDSSFVNAIAAMDLVCLSYKNNFV